MINLLTLENFRSFGERQEIPLQPISVLVGPNNAGKSNLLAAVRAARELVPPDGRAFERLHASRHRPPAGDGCCRIGWHAGRFRYELTLFGSQVPWVERVTDVGAQNAILAEASTTGLNVDGTGYAVNSHPMAIFRTVLHPGASRNTAAYTALFGPVVNSRDVHLRLDVLRNDSAVDPTATLGADGTGLAAVVGMWRGEFPEKSALLDRLIAASIPEIKRVLVRPPGPGQHRLVFEQADGERFVASEVSDGVLYFTALAAHTIEAPADALILMEEPERSIHPRRLRDLVDLLRDLATERRTQFLIATHSPVLLDAFRDEPDSILLLRRDVSGTKVRSLASVPKLREALAKANPGEMLADGFFNDPF